MTRGPDAGRLFLAVPLAEDLRRDLAAALRGHGPLPGRPVPPESWHLTLRFLGDTAWDALERVGEEVGRAPPGPPFGIRFGGYGAFPRASRASVLWLGVGEGAAALAALAESVEAAVARAGFPAERRPFRPHLTLSRLRPPEDATAALARLPPFPAAMPVAEVVLFRSHLGGGPARYEPLRRFSLEG